MRFSSQKGRPNPNPYLVVTREALDRGVDKAVIRQRLETLVKYNTSASMHAHKVIRRWLALVDRASRGQ